MKQKLVYINYLSAAHFFSERTEWRTSVPSFATSLKRLLLLKGYRDDYWTKASWEKRGWAGTLFSLENRKLRKDLINVYKYLMGGNKVKGARLFSVALASRRRKTGHKLKHMKCYLNTGKRILQEWPGSGRCCPDRL